MVHLHVRIRWSIRRARGAGVLFALGCAAVAGAAGCAPGPAVNVHNPDPAGKVPAIKQAVANHDRRVIPQLVKDLDSTDSAIRFYAIQGLRRLTGNEFGYLFFEDESQRAPAVKRWQEWLAQQPDLRAIQP